MKKVSNIILAGSALVAGLALAGCDSKAQKEVSQQAEAIDKSYEAQAQLTEAVAAGAPNAVQQAAENKAEALRNEGEKTKDHLKDMAKELDEVPKK